MCQLTYNNPYNVDTIGLMLQEKDLYNKIKFTQYVPQKAKYLLVLHTVTKIKKVINKNSKLSLELNMNVGGITKKNKGIVH